MAAFSGIIKYEGDNSSFVWKHPCEDFNTTTQLIVHESQEAILFMNGQALDMFGPGRHTLETQNIPQIGKFLKRTTGGKTPFHCEVYFINKTVRMSVKWGTDSKVRFLDPAYGVPLEIGACGEMNLIVSDARKLLVKLVGTMKGIAWEDKNHGFAQSLVQSFRPMISTAVKSSLASCIRAQDINILEIDQHLGRLSDALKASVEPGFEEYGLAVPEFFVTTVALPEDDPSFKLIRDMHAISLQKKVVEAEASVKTAMAESAAVVTAAERQVAMEKEKTATEIARSEAARELIKAQTEAQAAKIAGFAEAEVMRAKGYTEKDVMQAEVQKAYAASIGSMNISGGGAGDVVGLGVGLAAAGAVVPQIAEMFKGISPVSAEQTESVICPACGKVLPADAKFCLECGAAQALKCHACGMDIPAGAKFCLNCGKKI